MAVDDVANLKEGFSHLNTESLCLVGACYDTAIVIRENNDRASIKFWTKYALAGYEEIITVG